MTAGGTDRLLAVLVVVAGVLLGCGAEPDQEASSLVDPSDPPALLPAEDDVRLSCGAGGPSFPPSALEQAGGFEDADDPLAEALRQVVATAPEEVAGVDGPTTGWRVLVRTDDEAIVANQDLHSMTFERHGDGWTWKGSGGCDLAVALPEGVGRAAVALDPSHPAPAPEDRELHLLVNERSCAGGARIGDRLVGPQVRSDPDRVVIAAAVVPLEGMNTCEGIAPEPVTVPLGEPLGDRSVVDGLVWPRAPLGPPGDGNGVFPR